MIDVTYHKSGGTADGTVVAEELPCNDCGKYIDIVLMIASK
ncbi:MAG: hypothetical protein ACTSV2_16635 [Candidatus Thorarchaeota archaeon]